MKIIILAGGVGTRLWPISRKKSPKQFGAIIDNKSMIECTFDRFKKDFKKEDIFISTIPDFQEKIQKIFPDLPAENIIIEPDKRDSGPAMGYVALNLFLKFPDEPIAFIPSDHYIADVPLFIKSLRVAEGLIRETNKMVDIAVRPNFPSTVLGYTHIGELYKSIDNIQIYRFKGHTEKPDYKTAKGYLENGNYLWHANFYMWTPRLFLEAYKEYALGFYQSFMKIKDFLEKGDARAIEKEYQKLEKTSFDYAVTEKMDPEKVLIIKGNFGWSDIGAWDVLYDQLSKEHDENKNLIRGDWVGIDTSGSLIYGNKDKLIATIGIDDLVIIDTKDALLVCPHGRAQDVKKLITKLKEDGRERFL